MLDTEQITNDQLFQTLSNIKDPNGHPLYSLEKCGQLTPLINEINKLKNECNAVILAHTYTVPEIIYGVADFVGDSYALSKNATETNAQTIVFAAVRFMGETAKVLNPNKEVLLPAQDGGCTLADCIDASKVKELRRQYPDFTFVCYINTTVAVKAECDVCVTSGNINKVISTIPQNKIFFLPDKFMAQNLIRDFKKKGVKKEIKYYSGSCYTHEEFTFQEVQRIRQQHPDIKIVAHPECKPEICNLADYIGSTAQILDFIINTTYTDFIMLTEEGLGKRINVEFPQKRLIGPEKICKYMKSNTLEDIKRVLTQPTEKNKIAIDEPIRQRAEKCIAAMFKYTEGK